MSHYIIRESSCSMPSTCKGHYVRVAILEVQDDITSVSMISARARGVIRVVRVWDKLSVGTTPRCAAARARAEAQALADSLNDRLAQIAAAVVARLDAGLPPDADGEADADGRYVLHLVATHPSHGDTHQDPVAPRELGTYDTEAEARVAGRVYLRAHPEAWVQTQDSALREAGRDVEVQS